MSGSTPPTPAGWAAGRLGGWAKKYLNLTVKTVNRPKDAKGFMVLPRRWVVERSHARAMHARRHARDYERAGQSIAERNRTGPRGTSSPRSARTAGAARPTTNRGPRIRVAGTGRGTPSDPCGTPSAPCGPASPAPPDRRARTGEIGPHPTPDLAAHQPRIRRHPPPAAMSNPRALPRACRRAGPAHQDACSGMVSGRCL
ncbi:hypothetical protein CG736_25070 [Kitasatospora sp. CB02891]|nr:hypothetical protein CG736_25070 [Kitasatospora sp. CB02891]